MAVPHFELAESSSGYRQFTIGDSQMTESERIVSRFDLAELTDDRAAKIEAMAEALCDFDVDNNGGYVWGHRGDSWGSDYENGRDYYREMADAALGALQLWSLDALLDSVHYTAGIVSMSYHPVHAGELWKVFIDTPMGVSEVVHGTGPNRSAAGCRGEGAIYQERRNEMTERDDLAAAPAQNLVDDLKALTEEFDLRFQLTDPDAKVSVEQRTINSLFFALLEARRAVAKAKEAGNE